jgi:hypothetical protein
VSGTERWRDNWTVVAPHDAVRIDLPRFAAKRRKVRRSVSDLPAGTGVVLFASGPWAVGQCRRFASKAGLQIQGEYLAFPSAKAPAYLVEDAPASIRFFLKAILIAPFRTVLSLPIDAGLGVVRASTPWRLIRRLALGRVAVGTRI